MLKKTISLIIVLILLCISCAGAAYYFLVAVHSGEEIRQENIRKILAMESPVYYRDGESKIGVFFRDAHRQYIPYEILPKNFVNAIVAAEDNKFFTHHGFDINGIIRAMLVNIKAGRIVQGGSTITQQTAKNLFKRKSRSFRSKFKELLFALRLEYHYPKEKILEFYANQFYVSGNGHGIGVAAKYFFDKDVTELNTLECAFIAGSVKRPNYYNPFIKKDVGAVSLAKNRAMERATYVLRQMYKLGMLDAKEYQKNLNEQLSFNNGRMFYALNTTMDLVKEALATPEIETALNDYGIDNVATSGIRVFTTVDKGLQESTLRALRRELSRLDIRLGGYDNKEVQQKYSTLSSVGNEDIVPGTFLFGTVEAIDRSPAASIHVSFSDQNKLPFGKGIIDEKALQQFLSSLVKWQHQRWTEARPADIQAFLDTIHVGDTVYASIREIDPGSGRIYLDLEKYPEIQGAVLVVKEGTIRAMAGGMENYFYNRALAARRPVGSVIKPLVYAAALQLGWNNVDTLNNERDLFLFANQAYFPRPDHLSPHARISMSWAGVHSENVATVWLLYHLCDQLSPAQFKELIAHLGLDQGPEEPYAYYQQRIRDKYGILVDRDSLLRAAFKKAVTEIGTDLIFSGGLQEYEFLKTLHYGLNFDTFLAETDRLSAPEYEAGERARTLIAREREIRREILARNYLRFMQLAKELQQFAQSFPDMTAEPGGRLYHEKTSNSYVYGTKSPAAGDWEEISHHALSMILSAYDEAERKQFLDSIHIEEKVRVGTLLNLENTMNREYKILAAKRPYSTEVLHSIDDFRVLAGLHYMVSLGRELGITSKLDPVLSFPLGSNVITLFEAARIYEGLTTGAVSQYEGDRASGEFAIIDRIEDSDGEVIYTRSQSCKQVFAPAISLAVSDILRNVVRLGTGNYAYSNVRMHSMDPVTEEQLKQLDLRVPLFGKTGTANNYNNATFLGAVPAISKNAGELSTQNGYIVAAYVGFDNNMPMVRNSTHITGSSGALPLWSQVANDILLEERYGENLDLIDILFLAGATGERPEVPLSLPDLGQITLPVDRGTGLPRPASSAQGQPKNSNSGTVITTFGKISKQGELEPARHFMPYWRSGQTN